MHPLPEPERLDLDAGFFVSHEPYADGTAPIAVGTSPDGQPIRLALRYPAASVTGELTLDQQSRISEETLTNPKHLIARRIVYPGAD
jgi:copper transport protein